MVKESELYLGIAQVAQSGDPAFEAWARLFKPGTGRHTA